MRRILKYNNKGFAKLTRKALLFSILFIVNNTVLAQKTGTPAPRLWHGIERELRYHPDGQDFVIQNGTHRFNRALYGTNTAFRVEAGDLPEFALYLPGMGGNLKLGLIAGNQSKWLIEATSIEASYRPGTMLYSIKDPMLGNATLNIQVLAGADDENIIVKAKINGASDVKLFWTFGGATGKKFSRDGDIGADPESSFYLKPEYCEGNEFKFDRNNFTLSFNGKSLSEAGRYENDQIKEGRDKSETVTKNVLYGLYPASKQVRVANANEQASPAELLQSVAEKQPVICGVVADATKDSYWVIQNAKAINKSAAQLFTQAEAKRAALAGRVKVHTPDPFINTFGGALSVAADGIWESPSYMHGAVAWRMRLPAWRGPYVADPLGWHDRAWSHFSSYALSQVTEPASGPVIADTALHIARQKEQMGTAMFSSGYIARNPGGGKLGPHHYDMNLVYIDELLNHFKWTGNLSEVKQLWPTIKRSLAWEKRNYDADGDGLYDAYCAIWASDALQYSGGGVTHSSAYNYRANKAAAYLAGLVGDDPKPYEQEATHILNAMNKQLWLPSQGSYAEYKDLLGLQLVHPSAALWTVYHAIDSEVPDPFQTYQSLRYVDTQIPHIPVLAKGLSGKDFLLSTTNWSPYDWSLNNVVMAENLHTALAYWQGNRAEDAYKLWKSAILESMYLGSSPGNFQQISFYDNARGELYRDFGDPIGMGARSLVEGLFGIRPDLLKDSVTIAPGLPEDWKYASLETPDVKFDFKRDGQMDTYHITPNFTKTAFLNLIIPVKKTGITSISLNGNPIDWSNVENTVGQPRIRIKAGKQKYYLIEIVWDAQSPTAVGQFYGEALHFIGGDLRTPLNSAPLQVADPQQVLEKYSISAKGIQYKAKPILGHHTFFVKVGNKKLNWWVPIKLNVTDRLSLVANKNQSQNQLDFELNEVFGNKGWEVKVNPQTSLSWSKQFPKDSSPELVKIAREHLLPGTNQIIVKGSQSAVDTTLINWHITPSSALKTETINLKPYFNDEVTNIFKNKYLSPRPQSPTLQLPWQGIGNWAYPLISVDIDDSGLRKAAGDKGIFTTPQGVPFAVSSAVEKNILFTSRWDNYPHQASVPLSGKASHAYFLMAGTTNPMQSRMINGTVTVTYTDGSMSVLQLKNPENWWPIEQDPDDDGFAFNTGAPHPLRVHLKTGEVTDNNKKFVPIKGFSTRGIEGGAGVVLDLPLDGSKTLKALELKTLCNDVVIGLMAATLVRE